MERVATASPEIRAAMDCADELRIVGRVVDSEDSPPWTVQVRGEFAVAEWTGPGFGLSEDMEIQCPFLAHDQAASMDPDWSRRFRDCFVDCLPNSAWTLRDMLRW
jgi:hypothetical protein